MNMGKLWEQALQNQVPAHAVVYYIAARIRQSQNIEQEDVSDG